jgi:hypothetical protein
MRWRAAFVVREDERHIQGDPTGAAFALKMRLTTAPLARTSNRHRSIGRKSGLLTRV